MSHKSTTAHPPWLKAMQNGTLGEARTKAFLLERFWVLERSVDIDGADFIVQRRLTGKNLLDREAPRLGVVQIKFFGTPNTQHFVHKEYVLDDAGDPRAEFFLLCHAGDEERPRAFIASGEEIHKSFPLTTNNGREGYSITYVNMIAPRYEITSATRTLDRMERQLELAEFTKNRRFMSWALPSANLDLGAIEPVYREPIENWWGDIPKVFREIKETARGAMLDVEEVYNLLKQVADATDPALAEELIGEIAYNCRDGLGHWGITLPDSLYDEDFFLVCRRHKRMVEKLRADGLLDHFIGLKAVLRDGVADSLGPLLPVGPNGIHQFEILYDPVTLQIAKMNSAVQEAQPGRDAPADSLRRELVDMSRAEGIKSSTPGRIEYCWLPDRYCSQTTDVKAQIEMIRQTNFRLYWECMDAMFTMKYGEKDGA